MKSSSELREGFLAFFERAGHRRVASHSLIPPADPTLLFVNAGMVQFKDVFVGRKKVDYTRATTSQKCLRVSGKHNDLENVGRTARHHTFFEMLGNFSFGDYFKRDAIRFAYDFLMKEVGLDASRCYYTVFGGDEVDGLAADDEAIRYWMETAGIGQDRVLRFGKKDNFWAMGETGPCGPCSEILYDRGDGPWACHKPDCGPGCDCDRYVEIWNLVFMQYERKEAGGALRPLPAPSIDTGMGLERLACVVQGTPTNYETDLFLPLITDTAGYLEAQTGRKVRYGSGGEDDVALRVIADHARTTAFLVADGVYPDNEGRGYIARLLMRRAVRFGRKLGFQQPFFGRVCGQVVGLMGRPYPELDVRNEVIAKVVALEEESFSQTYDDGSAALQAELDRLEQTGARRVGGDFLFWLHDERGFQPDLVEVMAAERHFSIDRQGYDELMDRKRVASGKVMKERGGAGAGVWGAVADRVEPTEFLGYTQTSAQGLVVALVEGSKEVAALSPGSEGEVVLSQTPFYGESGGQVGDTGVLAWAGGKAAVLDTQKVPGDVFSHRVKVEQGTLLPGMTVEAAVDARRRAGIMAHHSGTHLLHWALEKVLGAHVKQEGSLVKDDQLRFDFRHFSPMTAEEIERIEELVAGKVLENSPVETEVTSLDKAVFSGAKAFFGEKYAQDVRLVSMGGDEKSRELCGGTHAARTGDIGLLKIVKQEAVSSGVRRIYAVCHMAAARYVAQRDRLVGGVAALLKSTPDELDVRLHKLLERNVTLEKQVKELQQKLLSGASSQDSAQTIEDVNGVKLAFALLDDADEGRTRSLSDLLRDRVGEGVVMAGGVSADKLLVVVAKTKGVPAALHCGKAVTRIAASLGGRGGGRPDFAQAGGCDPAGWPNAIDLLREIVREAKA